MCSSDDFVSVKSRFVHEGTEAWAWIALLASLFFFFSGRRRHTIFDCDWSSDVCSSDLMSNAHSHCLRVPLYLRMVPATPWTPLVPLAPAPLPVPPRPAPPPAVVMVPGTSEL